jgi:regulator of nonsense transcripts 2
LDERSQSLIKAAFYTVKPPRAGPRKQAKEYSPLESYLRHLLMVRLEPDSTSVSFVSKQIIRFPWNDPSKQCGFLVSKIMLKTCRKGRYKAIHAVAAVAANLRRHRPEVSIRLIDAVLEELRWAIEHPNFRDQQRIISYARLLGELFCVSLVSGQLIIQQMYNFINFGHEIPAGLREASDKHQQEAMAAGDTTAESGSLKEQLPVYNSAGGAVQAIDEDEEMEGALLDTKQEEEVKQQQPVAVSKYSEYDPRVPSPEDPPNSAFRVKLVCTLFEVVAKNLVTRNNLQKLKGFLAAFQRYLFTKTMLPTEVEFSLLDTFDVVDSMWRKAAKDQGGKGSKNRRDAGGDGDGKEEQGFPRYANWLEAHNATVALEEAEHLVEARTRARIEALAGESTAEAMDSIGDLLNDDDDSLGDEDDDDSSADEDPMSVSAKDSITEDHHFEIESGDEEEDGAEETMELSQYDETSDDESDDSNESETDDEDRSDEDEFDEEAYIKQMEEEAFERELRRVTMEALEKGKVAARSATGGKVADTMPSGSQIIKKKPAETGSSPSGGAPTMALGGFEGISFQLLKKGHKGKMEAKEIIVPADTNLAKTATKQDDAAARERDMIKARVLQYEQESAEARNAGGNVYLEQEKLQVIRNRPLSMEDIDRNFGTTGGNLRPNSGDPRPRTSPSAGGGRVGPTQLGGRGGGRGRGRGRGNAGGRSLYG